MEYIVFDIDNFTDQEYEKWFLLTSTAKQEKVNKYKDYYRKKSTVAAEMLVKEYIGKALKVTPESLTILTHKNGKPYIKDCSVHFNISHCDKTVLCAFSTQEIGADIEKIKPTTLAVAKRFFNEQEQEYVFGFTPTANDFKTCNDAEVLERFYTIYTIKEAICKKSGVGIKGLSKADALPYLQCSFKEEDNIISII